MEVKQILYMNAGEGEKSYTQNSCFQNKVQVIAKMVVQQALLEFYIPRAEESKNNNNSILRVADLGCAFGPNAWKVVTDVVDTVVRKSNELDLCLPEFQIFLNDLPNNDFNTVFRSLPEMLLNKKLHCCVAGVPGSYYERLFPSGSVDFFHSSSSMHWLSQVPKELQGEDGARLNNDNIYISQSSPQVVIDAYRMQFQRDFEKFLRCRSEEIVANGRMVFMWMGRKGADVVDEDYRLFWGILAEALNDMAVEGLVEKEKIITFNIPFYPPSTEEVMDVVEREGSFSIKFMDFFDVDVADSNGDHRYHLGGRNIARHFRAALGPLMATIVGEDLIDDLFVRYEKIVHQHYLSNGAQIVYLIVSLKREA